MTSKDQSSEQLNLRVSPALIGDIELLCKTLNVNKSEWIKTKLLNRYAQLADKGIIDKKELERVSKKLYQ